MDDYDAEAIRERGRQTAHAEQADIRQGDHIVCEDAAEWQRLMLEYVATRDRMRAKANQGNEEARRQADYLDGYLSQWD